MDLSSEWTDPNKPLYAELSPLIAGGRDADVAASLNRRDRPGFVPRRHVAATLARFPAVLGLVRWVVDSRTLLDGSPVPFAIYCLFAAIWLVVESDEGLNAGVADLEAGLSAMPPEMAPPEFREAILAGEVKVSRAEELHGRDISANEIETARKGN